MAMEDRFMFELESFYFLNSKEIIIKINDHLKKKCRNFCDKISKFDDEIEKKMEAYMVDVSSKIELIEKKKKKIEREMGIQLDVIMEMEKEVLENRIIINKNKKIIKKQTKKINVLKDMNSVYDKKILMLSSEIKSKTTEIDKFIDSGEVYDVYQNIKNQEKMCINSVRQQCRRINQTMRNYEEDFLKNDEKYNLIINEKIDELSNYPINLNKTIKTKINRSVKNILTIIQPKY
jgi:hypothetical protein